MPTDDERREVARRLRDNANQDWEWVVPWAVFNDAKEHDAPEIQQRLADLIEPGKPKVKCVAEVKIEGDKLDEAVHRAMAEYAGVDRAALLALASGLEADADRIIRAARNAQFGGGPRMGEAKLDADEWRSIARRIREALGVES